MEYYLTISTNFIRYSFYINGDSRGFPIGGSQLPSLKALGFGPLRSRWKAAT